MSGYRFYTYYHIRNDIGEVFYVGKGTGRRAFAAGRNPYWNNIVAKHGHTVHIVAYFEFEEDAFAHEKELIAELRAAGFNLANMTDGGEGAEGRVVSDETRVKLQNPSPETRAKMSTAQLGNKKFFGKKHSVESRAKISAYNYKRLQSDDLRAKLCNPSVETRAKLSAARKGCVASDETRAKISSAGKGNKRFMGKTHSQETRDKLSKVLSNPSIEIRAKLSASQTGNKKFLGKTHSQETRDKISAAIRARNTERTGAIKL